MDYRSKFLNDFYERGFLYQLTDQEEIDKLFSSEIVSGYIGFDCTANSLHVGSLMQIMILRLMQKHGHRPIIILGGGTTKIGDPSGKDEARKMLSIEEISYNQDGILQVLMKFLDFDGDNPNSAIMLDNDEWLSGLNYIEMLRDYGKYFSVNRMLSFDNVKSRLDREQNLSFLEFNYMILQSIDFVHLNKNYNCKIQFGGSDQWGNIISGIELGKKIGQNQLYGITSPLITTSSGAKMGKTANGAVWLSEDLLSPYDYFQFWRNVEDLDVERFLKIFTDIEISEINKMISSNDINQNKKILAYEATKLCHGEIEAKKALEAAIKIFEQSSFSEDVPQISCTESELESGINLVEFLHNHFNESKSEIRRLIKSMAIKVNNVKITDDQFIINKSHETKEGYISISMGKKKYIYIRIIR